MITSIGDIIFSAIIAGDHMETGLCVMCCIIIICLLMHSVISSSAAHVKIFNVLAKIFKDLQTSCQYLF